MNPALVAGARYGATQNLGGAFTDRVPPRCWLGRALSQLGSDRTEAEYDEPTITNEEAHDAIAKAQRVVEVIERAIAAGPGSAPAP